MVQNWELIKEKEEVEPGKTGSNPLSKPPS